MSKMHVKSGDTVKVLSGKSKGAEGKVIAVSPKENKVIVEKVNMVTKHVKPRQMGQPGGLIKAEAALYADKVQVVCPDCGRATRIGRAKKDGKSVRVCKKCGAQFE
ncbi:MAG: 50S ribosomal protein L24 [Clostridiales bacterium]|nr:50S ribosomal protein L24 [Clostridiales bacterium]